MPSVGPTFTEPLGKLLMQLTRLEAKHQGQIRLEDRYLRAVALLYEILMANSLPGTVKQDGKDDSWEELTSRRKAAHDLKVMRRWLARGGTLRQIEAGTGVPMTTIGLWAREGLPETFEKFDRVMTFIERNPE